MKRISKKAMNMKIIMLKTLDLLAYLERIKKIHLIVTMKNNLKKILLSLENRLKLII